MHGCAKVNKSTRIVAALLIISAGVSTFYTVQIAEEYSSVTEALVKFSAYTQYNIESVKTGYLDVNITFENPSKLPIHIYELDYLFCIYNSSLSRYERGGSSGGGIDITVNATSNKTIWFSIPLTGRSAKERNETAKHILYLYSHEKPFIVGEYMEIYYKVGDYEDYVNKYIYNPTYMPYYQCSRYGGGIFG
jgi:hypothetical protein